MKKFLIATSIALLASSAWAQKSPSGNTGFDGLDKNRDGFLSKEEIAGDKEMTKRFEKFDVNKDGRWTLDDFIKANKDRDARVVADSGITTKVKTALLTEKGIPSTAISVETYEGTVQLSGFVTTAAIKEHAGKVTAGVSGVTEVKNSLVVK